MLNNNITLKNADGTDAEFRLTLNDTNHTVRSHLGNTLAMQRWLDRSKSSRVPKAGSAVYASFRELYGRASISVVNAKPVSLTASCSLQIVVPATAEFTQANVKELVNYQLQNMTGNPATTVTDAWLTSLLLGEL